MTRLFYIHNIAMPGPEANTVNVAKMCNAFAANGCDVTLAALPGAPPAELERRVHEHYGLTAPFTVRALPQTGARPAVAAVLGAAMARNAGADIVYTRAPHVAIAACVTGLSTILEVHTDIDAFSSLGRQAFARAVEHERLRNVVAISGALAERLRQRIARTPERVIVAHDGADQPTPTPVLARDGFNVGFVGRLYRGKGLELIAELAPLCPWAVFHIVGGSADSAAQLLGAALPHNVVFHGHVPHAAVPQLIASFDVMLAPYQQRVTVADGRTNAAPWMSPLKIFEYMAAAKPMLISDLPVLREIVSDGETGLLLPPDDPAAWAGALERLQADPQLRQQLGARAGAVFLGRYTWTQRARHILLASGLAQTPAQARRA
jgi:glycosyltransferase involved in cell wall biosynthesis